MMSIILCKHISLRKQYSSSRHKIRETVMPENVYKARYLFPK